MRKQGFLSLLYTARWGSFFTFRDSESAGSGKPNMKSGSKNLRTAFFFRESSIFALRRTGKAAESDEKRQAEAMTRAVQEAGGERTIGMSNGSRRTAEDNEKRARVSGTFADNREVKSAVGARLSNAKRRQCPSAGKSCFIAVMPRAARIGEPNRPGRKMKQRRPTHGFRQRRCPCRRGARGITAKFAPQSAQIWALRENFLNFSKNFRFRCNEKAKNIVYIIYGIITGNICAVRRSAIAFSRVRTRKIRIRSRASPSIYANLRTVSSKFVPIYANSVPGSEQAVSDICKAAPDHD